MSRPKKAPFKQQEERRDGGLLLLVIALFLFVGALFLEGERGSRENASVVDSYGRVRPSRATLEKIDRALQEGYVKGAILHDSVEYENETAPTVSGDTSGTDINPLVFGQENPGARVLKETERRARREGATPDQRIGKKLARDEWARDYERRMNAEYVRQFIENARRAGVEVELNENLDVIGIEQRDIPQPIRIPQSLQRPAK